MLAKEPSGVVEMEAKKSLRQLYFILFTLGEKFPAHKSFVTFELEKHENYIRQAFYEGKVLAAAQIMKSISSSGIIRTFRKKDCKPKLSCVNRYSGKCIKH